MPDDRRSREVTAFLCGFADRAATWDEHPGDLVGVDPLEPWIDPDHPDPVLHAAYRGGIVPTAQRNADDGWDSITVLHARSRLLAKRIARDGTIIDYDAAKHFDLTEIQVDGLDHLEEDLRLLLHQPDRGVVRGRIADLGHATGVRRLLHPDGGDPASLIEVPRRWLALDVDGLARPAAVPAENLVACAGIAIAALPPAFHDARCIVRQPPGMAKPGIRLRRGTGSTGGQRRRAEALAAADWLTMPCSARANHLHAAPVFDGLRDPLPSV
jgi:hypothetical protein